MLLSIIQLYLGWIVENKYVFGEDYCLCMVANPNFYKHHCNWEPESNEEVGEYKKYRDRTIRYFWSNYASYAPMVGTMPISERVINPEPEYFYAPYIPVTRSEEESKLYKHMRRTVGCTNWCFFGSNVAPIGQCDKCYEEAKQKQNSKKEDGGSYINDLDAGVMASHLYKHWVEGD